MVKIKLASILNLLTLIPTLVAAIGPVAKAVKETIKGKPGA